MPIGPPSRIAWRAAPVGRRRWTLLAGLAVGLTLAALPSCARRRPEVRPPLALPEAFSAGGEAPLPARWWTAFGDPELNRLVDEALAGNFSLRTVWDRLDQARALVAQSGAPLWPTVDVSAGASRAAQRSPATGRVYSSDYSLGVLAAYEVDLWGRIRSTHAAARLDAEATAEDLHAAAVTLAAEVAASWYLLVEQTSQLALLREQTKTNETYLEIITLKFRRGQVSATDVLQQDQLVESNRGERALVESAIRMLEHRLAVLVGRPPGRVTLKVPGNLPPLPPRPQTGVPAEWVRRRPDVRAAELRVAAADGRVAAAVADQFPRLGLMAGAQTSNEEVRALFDNYLATLAADLVTPIIDGNRRGAEVERTRAVLSERLNAYGHAVLLALEEVEGALTEEAKQAEYVESLEKQLGLSNRSTNQTRENYTASGVDFTRYLTTLLAHQRLQRRSLEALRGLVHFRIDLYRALAASWGLARPPEAEAAATDPPQGNERS